MSRKFLIFGLFSGLLPFFGSNENITYNIKELAGICSQQIQPTEELINEIKELLAKERSEQEKISKLMKQYDITEDNGGIFNLRLSTHKLLEEYYANLLESILNK